ncbi:hypothetical protein PHMEG_00022270 [Phytophthora megakarya]|uniref:Uncharacterized protein n=1 Tax=Phytophthora megakarya TaxID=4795 RepID=A0A225VM54_9STRA|nr:hypothetical protein PHMEG_00022270 [Phytophthora megakarya]
MEQVVEQQLNSRKRSERENKRLRKLLQTQRRKSRQLLRVLKANYMGAEVSSLAEVPADNSTVFEDLSSKLDEMILDVMRAPHKSILGSFSQIAARKVCHFLVT